MPRPNWSRALPQPPVIPTVMTLKTLADVRTLLRHLPEDQRKSHSSRHVPTVLEQAAAGAEQSRRRSVALALMFGGCRVLVQRNPAPLPAALPKKEPQAV